MKRFILTSIILLLFSNVALAATMQSLTQSQVNNQLKGKTITTIPLITIDGALINNTVTAYFNENGKLAGHMAKKPDNGSADDTGKWIVKPNGTLCSLWDNWNSNKDICVSIYKVNNGLLLINDNTHKLETIVLNDNIKNGNTLS